jgi:phosphoglycolate phosphatase
MGIIFDRHIIDHHLIDSINLTNVLRSAGRYSSSDYNELMSLIKEEVRILGEGADHLRAEAMPGAHSTVKTLQSRGVRQAVVTGNLAVTARLKLSVTGLLSYVDMEVSAFGDDVDQDKVRMLQASINAVRRKYGEGADDRIVMLGDSVIDMRASSAVGCKSVAVATGRDSFEELRDAHAHQVLRDLSDIEVVLAAISNEIC